MNGHTPGPWIVAPSTAHAGNPDSKRVDAASGGITPDARHADPVAILRKVLRWYRETTDGEMPPDLHDAVCRAVGEEVVP